MLSLDKTFLAFSILTLPLFGFIFAKILKDKIAYKFHIAYFTTSLTFLSFLGSLTLAFFFLSGKLEETNVFEFFDWINTGQIFLKWGMQFDSLSCVMLLIVTFISSLVHLYSTDYMKDDPNLIEFMSYLSLFTFFMLILVSSTNLLQLFVGWEGVGVSSYLLISFWNTRIQANKAAIKAMLVNRIGDYALILALFTIFALLNTLDYNLIKINVNVLTHSTLNFFSLFEIKYIDLICFLLFVGAMGKSAQLGLHSWLPDAMEGPTPVSALIHAATMVTAGIFLLARCSFLFEESQSILTLITIVGALTAFFAGTVGCFQNDMKKVIAYSTCSQLGYMVLACGLSNYHVAVFHLSNHAFFKAALFLAAGSTIHAMNNEQDMRKMGGLYKLIPFTFFTTMVASMALLAFPPFAGFFSKEIILNTAFMANTNVGYFAYVLGILAAFCTAFYSTRLIYMVFIQKPMQVNKDSFGHGHEGSYAMTIPLFLLAILSIVIGYLTKDLFLGMDMLFWRNVLDINPTHYYLQTVEFMPLNVLLMPLFITLFGIFSFFLIRKRPVLFIIKRYNKSFYKFLLNLVYFFNKKWFFDRFYNEFIGKNFLKKGLSVAYNTIDRGILEFLGPYGLTNIINFASRKFSFNTTLKISNVFFNLFSRLFVLISVFIIYIYFIL